MTVTIHFKDKTIYTYRNVIGTTKYAEALIIEYYPFDEDERANMRCAVKGESVVLLDTVAFYETIRSDGK